MLLLLTKKLSLIQMDFKNTYCVGVGHKSNTIDIIVYEKVNRKTQKFVKVREKKSDICGRPKSQFFTK